MARSGGRTASRSAARPAERSSQPAAAHRSGSRPSRLELSLLGPVDVRVDGAPLRTDTRKAVALLAYLSLRETPPDREHLVDLLWTEAAPERGRGALRRTLSSLRTALGGRWLVTEGARVLLEKAGLRLDLDRLGDDPAVAAAIVRGRFMDGFQLKGAPAFEAWQTATAEHYERVVRQVLVAAGKDALERGDPACVTLAERLIELDPLDEVAHGLLMRAHAAMGDRASATRQFRRFVALLDAELAVEPLPETVALHEAILRGEVVAAPLRRPVVARSPAPPPFLGREVEMAALREAVARPGVVWLLGPRGSGRSRLLAETLPEALVVAPAAGSEHEAHALTRALLDRLLEGTNAGPAAGPGVLLDEAAAAAGHLHAGVAALVGEPPPLYGELGTARLLAGVASAVAGLAAGKVVAVDDADGADPASNAALRHLAERATELGIRLVLVAQAPAEEGSGVPDKRLTLGPLPLETVARMVEGTDLRAGALAAATGGWPGAVLEVLTDPSPELAVDRVRSRRLGQLGPVARQVAEALAVLGASDLQTLTSVAGRGYEETAEAIDLLVAERMAVASGRLEPAGWAADALLANVGPARRVLLHGRAAEALRRSPRPLDAVLAHHLEQAGRLDEAAESHGRAAAGAAKLHAHESVRFHVRGALADGHRDPGMLHRLLGDTERAAGRYQRAVAAYHAAAAYGTDVALERVIGDVYRRWGRWDLALASFEAAEALASPDELPLVLADRAEVSLRAGDRGTAEALVARALEVGGSGLARVRNVAGLVLDEPEHLSAAVALARRAGEREAEAAALNNLALARLARGSPGLALEAAQRALALLDRGGDRHRRAAVHGNLADIHHALGDEERSHEHLRTAARLFAEVGIEPGEWDAAVWSLTSW